MPLIISLPKRLWLKSILTNGKLWALLDRIIIFFVLNFLLVDTINGILIRSFDISAGKYYKIFVMILISVSLLNFAYKKFYQSYLILIILLIPSFVTFFETGDSQYLSMDLNYALKISFIFISFYYFQDLFRRDEVMAMNSFKKFIYISFSILSINLVLGILGFGFGQYGDIGSVGFFYAGNEVSGVMIAVFAIVSYLIYSKKRKYYILIAVILIVLALFKATKVAIGGTFLIIILIPLVSERNRIWKFTTMKAKYFIASIALFPPLLYFIYLGIVQTGLLNRFLYFYEKLDFLTFILSNRNLSAIAGMKSFTNDYNAFEMLFGKGYKAYYDYVDPVFGIGKIVEIDFFDLLLMFGIVGVITIFSFWFMIIYKTAKKTVLSTGKYYFAPAVFLANFLLFIFSILSGHIMYSGLAGIFISFSNAAALNRNGGSCA